MKKIVSILLASMMLLSLAACGGSKAETPAASGSASASTPADEAKVYEMKCSTFVNSGSAEMELLEEFTANVAKATDNHVIIKIYPGEQLGGYEQTFEETMRGTIEFGINSPAASFDNRLSCTNVPGLFTDFDTAEKLLAPGATLPSTYAEAMEGLGLKFLAFFPGGFYNLALNVDPPANYNDAYAKKDAVIRVNTYEVTEKTVDSLGYRTETLPGSEFYTALETGIVDGGIGIDYAFILSGFSDVVSNIIETHALMSCDSVFMNLELFNSLPEEYQKAIEQCALDFQQACIDHQRNLEDTVKPQLEEKGIKIISLTDEELDAVQNKLREDVWPWVEEQFGQEFMDGVKADAGIN